MNAVGIDISKGKSIVAVLRPLGEIVHSPFEVIHTDFGNNTLRKVKSDKADSIKIARYGLDNWADLSPYTVVDQLRIQLKSITRQYDFYSKSKTALKNNLIGLLDQTYPGINAMFTSTVREDGSQNWVDFVTIFLHVECVTSLSLQAFTEKYQKWCYRYKYKF